jgi:hypothetical protein
MMDEFETAKYKQAVELLAKLDTALSYVDTSLIHLHNGLAKVSDVADHVTDAVDVTADRFARSVDAAVTKAQDGVYKVLNFLDAYRNELKMQAGEMEDKLYPAQTVMVQDTAAVKTDDTVTEVSPFDTVKSNFESSFLWPLSQAEDIATDLMTRDQALSFLAEYYGVPLQSIQKAFASTSDDWVRSSVAIARGEI